MEVMEKSMTHGYEPNEKDIDGILNYLTIFHPKIATPEWAVTLAQAMHASAHSVAHGQAVKLDEEIERILKELLKEAGQSEG